MKGIPPLLFHHTPPPLPLSIPWWQLFLSFAFLKALWPRKRVRFLFYSLRLYIPNLPYHLHQHLWPTDDDNNSITIFIIHICCRFHEYSSSFTNWRNIKARARTIKWSFIGGHCWGTRARRRWRRRQGLHPSALSPLSAPLHPIFRFDESSMKLERNKIFSNWGNNNVERVHNNGVA